jgi:hypothetical protein
MTDKEFKERFNLICSRRCIKEEKHNYKVKKNFRLSWFNGNPSIKFNIYPNKSTTTENTA